MRPRVLIPVLLLAFGLPALAEDGLRLPVRPGAGIDPAFAGGWLSPERDRFNYAPYHWRDSIGFAPNQRMQWSYALGARSSFGMSVTSGKDFLSEPVYGTDVRRYGLIGQYSIAPDWSFSAETVSRDPGALFRMQDLRFGIRRQF
ncbi:MAG: hypothetical protein JO035_11805 [Betaproteobacteria bacterium]|nr:hypothetical protein [Betaproteobacteria bacterium]